MDPGRNSDGVERILSATNLLFGERVYTIPGFRDPDLLLAWLANAYDRRDRLDHPARLVHNRLTKGARPDSAYLADPCHFLPLEFLEAIGLRDPPATLDPDNESDSDSSPPVDGLSATDPPAGPAVRGWEAAVGQLKLEMPQAAFETWVRPVELVTYADGVFVLGAPTIYARDWLESRITSTLARLLTGIMNQSCAVKFVVFAREQRI